MSTSSPQPMKCPKCGEPVAPREENRSFPFCSRRCKMADLGAWFQEEYRVPDRTTPASSDDPGLDGYRRGEN